MFYLIPRTRFLEETDKLRRHNKGVLNWFIDNKFILNVFYDIDNVKYLYRVPMIDAREDTILKSFLGESRSILGVEDYELFEEKEQPKAEPIEEVVYGNID